VAGLNPTPCGPLPTASVWLTVLLVPSMIEVLLLGIM
jgi:hypothetical protein